MHPTAHLPTKRGGTRRENDGLETGLWGACGREISAVLDNPGGSFPAIKSRNLQASSNWSYALLLDSLAFVRGRGPFLPVPAIWETGCGCEVRPRVKPKPLSQILAPCGKPYRTRGGNQKPWVFPRSRLKFTLKAGSKVGAV